jgi:hypothetical protein
LHVRSTALPLPLLPFHSPRSLLPLLSALVVPATHSHPSRKLYLCFSFPHLFHLLTMATAEEETMAEEQEAVGYEDIQQLQELGVNAQDVKRLKEAGQHIEPACRATLSPVLNAISECLNRIHPFAV